MKPNLPIPTYSSDMFTWNKNRAVADASDFGPLSERGTNWIGVRLFNDAYDIGFYVQSTKTGVKMLFTYLNDEDGYDGELQVYTSGDYTITIYND